MKEEIFEFKKTHPTWGYRKIARALSLSPNSVKYHLDPQGKQKATLRKRVLRAHVPTILKRKKDSFQCIAGWRVKPHGRRGRAMSTFTLQTLKSKIENQPSCYLTGRPIDLTKSNSYQLDHIIPISAGGDNSIENCGLTCKEANIAKSNLSVNSFLSLCQDVLRHHGYIVMAATSAPAAHTGFNRAVPFPTGDRTLPTLVA